ncbi:DNA repair protein RAD51 homolog 3-like [Oscarella lobularis]|uniref:DNA repair protein RAD51 homolog 3-like n=1 Tax=Oscarella lobularis TaxID=121494 RepID=UPI0033139700
MSSLSAYSIRPEYLKQLNEAGFVAANDLNGVDPVDLSREANIPRDEALKIIKAVRKKASNERKIESQTALEIFQRERLAIGIVSFSEKIDEIIGNGVPLGKITELCGSPGVGKTQMCMQLAIDVQFPPVFGGLDGEAFYIDTEGGFVLERVTQIAKAAQQHLRNVARVSNEPDQEAAASRLTPEYFLSRIYHVKCVNYAEVLAHVNLLGEFLQEHPKIKLVVIDSVAFPFRQDFDDFATRTRILNGMAQTLIEVATKHNLAIVLTNHLTTRFNRDSVTKTTSSSLQPALGESWGHACTIRILLLWEETGGRLATLYKSPNKQRNSARYQITTDGVRDIPDGDGKDGDEHPAKRRREIESV